MPKADRTARVSVSDEYSLRRIRVVLGPSHSNLNSVVRQATHAYDYEHTTIAAGLEATNRARDGCKIIKVWTQPQENDCILSVCDLGREPRSFCLGGLTSRRGRIISRQLEYRGYFALLNSSSSANNPQIRTRLFSHSASSVSVCLVRAPSL